MSNDLSTPDPLSIATARLAADEAATRKAKVAGADLIEAVLCAAPGTLPASVRVKAEAAMKLVVLNRSE